MNSGDGIASGRADSEDLNVLRLSSVQTLSFPVSAVRCACSWMLSCNSVSRSTSRSGLENGVCLSFFLPFLTPTFTADDESRFGILVVPVGIILNGDFICPPRGLFSSVVPAVGSLIGLLVTEETSLLKSNCSQELSVGAFGGFLGFHARYLLFIVGLFS